MTDKPCFRKLAVVEMISLVWKAMCCTPGPLLLDRNVETWFLPG